MKIKKPIILVSAIILALIVALPFALAADMSNPFSSLKDILYSAMSVLLDIFKLGFLKESGDFEAFMRLIIWIISFAVFNVALNAILSKSMGGAKGAERLPVVISFALATVTSVFMPSTVLTAIGVQYSAIWAAVLMGSVFAGLVWVCFKLVKAETVWGHLLRLAILILCWFLIFNFTSVVEQSGAVGSGVYTPFINPILEYLWEFLQAFIGIMILYEIFKVISSIGKGTIGNLGGHLSNAGGWVNKTKDGMHNLGSALRKRGTDEARQESNLLGQASMQENIISNMLDMDLRDGKKLSENLKVIQEKLGLFAQKLKPIIEQPKNYNSASVLKANNTFMKGVADKIKECKRLDETRLAREIREYDQATKEFNEVNIAQNMLRLSETYNEVNTLVANNPTLKDDPAAKQYGTLFYSHYKNITEKIQKLKDLDQKKIRYSFQAERNGEFQRKRLDEIQNEINKVNWKKQLATPEAIEAISRQIQSVIDSLTTDEAQLHETYVINRDVKTLVGDVRTEYKSLQDSYSKLMKILTNKEKSLKGVNFGK